MKKFLFLILLLSCKKTEVVQQPPAYGNLCFASSLNWAYTIKVDTSLKFTTARQFSLEGGGNGASGYASFAYCNNTPQQRKPVFSIQLPVGVWYYMVYKEKDGCYTCDTIIRPTSVELTKNSCEAVQLW